MTSNKNLPLLPKATAVWLIDNTSLTFKQIAEFCGLHELEVKGIADGEVAVGIAGLDPVAGGQLTYEEIGRCSRDKEAKLQLTQSIVYDLAAKKKKQGKYTPIVRRQDKPDAVYWLLKNCPNIQDRDIIRLIGTTKSTIMVLRERTHWNMKNIRPRDPVLLGLCSQVELDKILESAAPYTVPNQDGKIENN